MKEKSSQVTQQCNSVFKVNNNTSLHNVGGGYSRMKKFRIYSSFCKEKSKRKMDRIEAISNHRFIFHSKHIIFDW